MKYLLSLLSILTLCTLLTSCSKSHSVYDSHGAEQFVIDSYKIRQGKFSILEMEGIESPPLASDLLTEYKDAIDEDDILKVAVYHPTRKEISEAVNFVGETVGYRVTNGQLLLPDLDPVDVIGLTLDNARQKIRSKYLEQIQDIEVFLAYKERLTRKVDLIGMVSVPNIPVDGKIRLFEILAKAQIPDSANLFMSYVIRDNKPLSVDLYKLVKQGDMSQNVVMCGGDKIYIAAPNEARVMVMGEVGNPKPIDLPHGCMSVREALVSAGGIPFTGDKRMIQVIRGNILHPKIYILNWNHILHLPNDSLLLIPGDTVYVAAKPITEWNRFISQLLPSFYGVQTAYTTAQIAGAK